MQLWHSKLLNVDETNGHKELEVAVDFTQTKLVRMTHIATTASS